METRINTTFYTVTLSKIGYQTRSLTVNVTNDDLNVVQATMEKVITLERLKA